MASPARRRCSSGTTGAARVRHRCGRRRGDERVDELSPSPVVKNLALGSRPRPLRVIATLIGDGGEAAGDPLGAAGGRADQQAGVVGGDRGRADEDRIGGRALGVDPVEVLGARQDQPLGAGVVDVAVERGGHRQQHVRTVHGACRAAASRRELTPSLVRIAETWWSTVRTERTSRAAISGLERPSASRRQHVELAFGEPGRVLPRRGRRPARDPLHAELPQPSRGRGGRGPGAEPVEAGERGEDGVGIGRLRQLQRLRVGVADGHGRGRGPPVAAQARGELLGAAGERLGGPPEPAQVAQQLTAVALHARPVQPLAEQPDGLVGQLGSPREPRVFDGGQRGGREDGEHVGAPGQLPRPLQPLVGVVGAAAHQEPGQHRQRVPGEHARVRVRPRRARAAPARPSPTPRGSSGAGCGAPRACRRATGTRPRARG